MKKIIFILSISLSLCINMLYAQRTTQATIVFWDQSQENQIIDNVSNFTFNNNQLVIAINDGSTQSINISEIRKITLATANSIESFDENSDLLIYPNPVSEQLHFACNNPQNITVSVYAVNGQLLIQREINTTETLDVSSLHTGMYVIKIGNHSYKFNKL